MYSVNLRATSMLNLGMFNCKKIVSPISKLALDTPKDELKILRMQLSDGANLDIPNELKWLTSLIEYSKKYQEGVVGVKHPFMHITVRHGFVDSVTDDEWHVDGFSTKYNHLPEQNYVWCSDHGTELSLDPIKFPDDFNSDLHNLNHYFADTRIKLTDTLRPGHLYCLDPYIPHRRPTICDGSWRTFVRLTFSPIEVADSANTSNPNQELHHPKSRIRNGIQYRNNLIRYKL